VPNRLSTPPTHPTLAGIQAPSRVPPPPPPPREDSIAVLTRTQAELRDARVEIERQREQIKGRDSTIAELQAKLNERDATIAAHAQQLAEARTQQVASVPAGDDLKRIRGIGPGFERVLQGAGITTFATIAAWTAEDVVRVANLLNTQPARIERGAWISQAQALCDQAPTAS
jgi:predicted flap endonuclease-1-like 5' DNA nuclease